MSTRTSTRSPQEGERIGTVLMSSHDDGGLVAGRVDRLKASYDSILSPGMLKLGDSEVDFLV